MSRLRTPTSTTNPTPREAGSQFGTFPEEHSQSGVRPSLGSGLPDVEHYDDLFLLRNPAHYGYSTAVHETH